MAEATVTLKLRCACGKLFEVPQKLAGKRIQCKQCKHVISVPIPPSISDVVEREEGAEGAEEARDAELLGRTAGEFQTKWVFTGALVLWGLLLIAGIALSIGERALRTYQIAQAQQALEWMADPANHLILAYAIPSAFFAFGGALIAWQSAGRTVAEPVLAAILALAVPLGLGAFLIPTGDLEEIVEAAGAIDSTYYGVPLAALLAAGVGAFIGEYLPMAD